LNTYYYLPTLNTDGEVKPVNNVDNFDRQNSSVITYADLQDYAIFILYGTNNCFGSLEIFVTSINNIASTILDYIETLRSDAQAQIDTKTILSEVQANNNVSNDGNNIWNYSIKCSARKLHDKST
jgi:L-rhamnose mutarotase